MSKHLALLIFRNHFCNRWAVKTIEVPPSLPPRAIALAGCSHCTLKQSPKELLQLKEEGKRKEDWWKPRDKLISATSQQLKRFSRMFNFTLSVLPVWIRTRDLKAIRFLPVFVLLRRTDAQSPGCSRTCAQQHVPPCTCSYVSLRSALLKETTSFHNFESVTEGRKKSNPQIYILKELVFYSTQLRNKSAENVLTSPGCAFSETISSLLADIFSYKYRHNIHPSLKQQAIFIVPEPCCT